MFTKTSIISWLFDLKSTAVIIRRQNYKKCVFVQQIMELTVICNLRWGNRVWLYWMLLNWNRKSNVRRLLWLKNPTQKQMFSVMTFLKNITSFTWTEITHTYVLHLYFLRELRLALVWVFLWLCLLLDVIILVLLECFGRLFVVIQQRNLPGQRHHHVPHLWPVLPLPETVRQLHLRQGTWKGGRNVPSSWYLW